MNGSDSDNVSNLGSYMMSSVQLHQLWVYEQILQALLLGMQFRNCIAQPSTTWGKEWEMSGDSFRLLKSEIRSMYVVASSHFTARKVHGCDYGLFVLPKSQWSGSM